MPVVVIAGRPNVGKSTLFNALTRTRDALVADQPGVTRDRIYGRAQLDGRDVLLVDTGGLDPDGDRINQRAQAQTRAALQEADLVLLVVDGREPPGGEDYEIAQSLRKLDVPVRVAVNKTDGIDIDQAIAEFSALGLPALIPIAAAHRRGLESLSRAVLEALPPAAAEVPVEGAAGDTLRLALIGRPNVGKSTLLNRLLGEERAVTADQPGTTRDPVRADLERDGQLFQLVDTAGIRRRRAQHEAVESLSTLKALQAMERADVVCLLLDSSEGITDQDARLAGHVVEAGRGLVVVLNKWDSIDEKARNQLLKDAGDDLKFVSWAPVVILSALHGSGIGELLDAVRTVYDTACRRLSSGALSRVLEKAVEAHAPAVVQRFAPKLRYAHAGGNFPTRIIIHGNRTQHVQPAYRRYLINRFRESFDLVGVPIQLIFRDSENPFSGRRNTLTPRQIKRRQRVRKRKR
ncbi:ribosome biogenesis GTPase Der [Wenzhouxiangella sp. XN79A]|nr:ribosome biogenesis GTPase Der [Wenzhouxiangella sp. XN79A]NKI34550.1 ribosome biogenesis GTPase Der [Wenzhouxiangella sp. XN79A]